MNKGCSSEELLEDCLRQSLRRNDRLQALVKMMGQISSTLDREQLLRMILDQGRELLETEACSLFFKDPQTGEAVLHLASNISSAQFEQMRVPPGQGIIGYVIDNGETVLTMDTRSDDRHYDGVDRETGFNTRNLLAVPLQNRRVLLGGEHGEMEERIIGGFEAVNKQSGVFDQEDVELLQALTNQAATVLQIADLYNDLRQLYLGMITAMVEAVDARDQYTVGHSRRVSDYSVRIAQVLQLPPAKVYQVRIGSLLHDFGKIGISDLILCKPGKLTPQEYDQMKEHPLIGHRILSQVHLLHDELPAVLEHHERLDGSGYPYGLKGDQISLIGRIVAVADVYDAMTSDRPYRSAAPSAQALEYLRGECGRMFDVACVDALEQAVSLNEAVS